MLFSQELHAHLNGSITPHILSQMGCPQADIDTYTKLCRDSTNGLSKFFRLCRIAHAITSNPSNVYKVTVGVITEFYLDNVIYLELRTTPRAGEGMTKTEYVKQVVKAINDVTSQRENMVVKLLLSINRCHSVSETEDSLNVIVKMKELHPDLIRGVDLCGDPSSGSFNATLFEKARESGLYVTLHCGEVSNENEVVQMLHFEPDRLGHGTFLHPKYGGSENIWKIYEAQKIPLGW